MANRRTFLELLEKWAIILGGIAAMITLNFAAKAYYEYKAANRVAARGQLYSTSEQIAERERNDPDYGLLFIDFPATVPVDGYSKQALGSITKTQTVVNARNAEELFHLIWGIESWEKGDKKELHKLRKIYSHTESYIYLVHNAFDYKHENIMDDGEWKTWLAYIDDVGGNPMTLVVMWVAHRRGYFNRQYAMELQNKYRNDPILKERATFFYKELLDDQWLESFSTY